MEELELGQATIVYEDPEEGVTEETVDNEMLVYARDHWMVKSGTDEEGNDQMKQIPRDRVHRVDRSVQRFEDEARTVKRRVESIAKDLQQKIPMDVGDGRKQRGGRRGGSRRSEGHRIPVEEADEEQQQ